MNKTVYNTHVYTNTPAGKLAFRMARDLNLDADTIRLDASTGHSSLSVCLSRDALADLRDTLDAALNDWHV